MIGNALRAVFPDQVVADPPGGVPGNLVRDSGIEGPIHPANARLACCYGSVTDLCHAGGPRKNEKARPAITRRSGLHCPLDEEKERGLEAPQKRQRCKATLAQEVVQLCSVVRRCAVDSATSSNVTITS